ncbi:MAG: response regulator [Nitrospinae bacterium]|nr:response regulator [Nitrospinota bacterium]
MGIKLLFADDSVTMQKVIQLTLENEDVELSVAGDGNAAYALVREKTPDVVIADVSMPGMDGYDLCEKLRRDPLTAGIPVILISGELEQYDAERGKAAGADGHITKPFKSSEFIETIQKIAAKGGSPARKQSAKKEAELSAAPSVLELVTKTKAASAGNDEEVEIVDEDIDDLAGELDDVEPGLEEDLLEPEEPEDETVEEPSLKEEAPEEEEVENVLQPEDASAMENVLEGFGSLSRGEEIVREVAPEEIGEGFSIYETEEPPSEFERREARKSEEAEKILADVFGEEKPAAEELPVEEPDVAHTVAQEEAGDATVGEEELWHQTLEELGEEMKVAATPSEEPQEAAPVDTIFAPPVGAQAGAPEQSLSAPEMEAIFRQTIEHNVAEFIRTQAPDIFKDEMSKAIDRHVKEIFETQMEKALREETAKMIAASFQKSMPKMLGIIEKITVQITPKIAQHMIKLAIERIQKGETH